MSYSGREGFNSYPQQFSQPSIQSSRSGTASHQTRLSTPQPSERVEALQQAAQQASPTATDIDNRLPSISNLLGIADARRPAGSARPQEGQRGPISSYSSIATPYTQEQSTTSNTSPRTQTNHKRRWDSSDAAGHTYVHQQRAMEPPSRQSEASFDPYQQTRAHMGSPSAASDGSYYSPTSTMSVQPGMHPGQMVAGYPSSAVSSASQSTPNLPGMNPWEHHHHYIGQSAQQGIYPPLPDRYICPTCNKAFSRPSSLKIHSHSHTGEKPFRCPHAGCNKAFSVKSNMKRHEKGCHRAPGQAHLGAPLDVS